MDARKGPTRKTVPIHPPSNSSAQTLAKGSSEPRAKAKHVSLVGMGGKILAMRFSFPVWGKASTDRAQEFQRHRRA